MRKTLMLCGLVLLPAMTIAQSMPNVRPVPGSGAAYLYFPAETEGRVKLSITKDFGNMVRDRYAVYYQPRPATRGREELICKEDEEQCEKLVPAGQGRIRIAGYYDPGQKLPINRAKFSGACSTTGAVCTINLRNSGTETVRITTGCNGSDYSVITLGTKDEALCVGPGISDRNSFLLAAHKHIRAKRTKAIDRIDGDKSDTDGKANTQALLNGWDNSIANRRDSAADYCNGLTLGEKNLRFSGWYVPAIKELDQALAGWDNKDQSFIIPKDNTGYFSSTEGKTGGRGSQWGSKTIRWNGSSKSNDNRPYTDAASILCMYSVAM